MYDVYQTGNHMYRRGDWFKLVMS